MVGERILLTLWVGGLWTIGFIVAPTLFASLDDRALAGTLAGSLFELIAWIGLVCGVGLLIANRFQFRGRLINWRMLVLLAMLALVVIGQFVLAPLIADLRVTGATDSSLFARLHGLAATLYMLTSVLGLALVAAPPEPNRNA